MEAIIGTRLRHDKLEYLVKWLHYPTYDNTWEPKGNYDHCKEMIADFIYSLQFQTKSCSRKTLSNFP